MRHLATIETIRDIKPIEGADAIEKVQVKDWWCVAKKGEFQVGDLCVYFEIDSLLPSSNPEFAFLANGKHPKTMVIEGKEYQGYRLRTIKLRGQISQGLALPAGKLFGDTTVLQVGDDVSEALEVVKYEAPIPAQLVGKIKGSFPHFLKKTDEERIQNLGEVLYGFQGMTCFVTEKLDGTSFSAYKHQGVFGVCSRNLDLLDTSGNTHWEIAKKYKIEEKLLDGFAIQGEIVGEGIQGNPLKIQGQELYVYNVFDIYNHKYLDFDEFRHFVEKMELKTVPIVEHYMKLHGTVEDILQKADGKSLICSTADREGIVIRPHKERTMEIKQDVMRVSFKAISNNYLLNHNG